MPLADFKIATHVRGQPFEVQVIVYGSLSALRSAATQYDNAQVSPKKRTRGDNADLCGVCHRFGNFDRDGNLKPLCAIVRYADPYIGVGVISHEMCHAAVWIRELSGEEEPLECANDETLCSVLGELVRQTINGMNERGLFDDD